MNETNEKSVLSSKLLRAVEVAEILNISKSMAYQMMQKGVIKTIKIGKIRRVHKTDLKAFIDNKLDEATNEKSN